MHVYKSVWMLHYHTPNCLMYVCISENCKKIETNRFLHHFRMHLPKKATCRRKHKDSVIVKTQIISKLKSQQKCCRKPSVGSNQFLSTEWGQKGHCFRIPFYQTDPVATKARQEVANSRAIMVAGIFRSRQPKTTNDAWRQKQFHHGSRDKQNNNQRERRNDRRMVMSAFRNLFASCLPWGLTRTPCK